MFHHHQGSRMTGRGRSVWRPVLLYIGNQAKLTHKLSRVSVITLQDVFLARTPIRGGQRACWVDLNLRLDRGANDSQTSQLRRRCREGLQVLNLMEQPPLRPEASLGRGRCGRSEHCTTWVSREQSKQMFLQNGMFLDLALDIPSTAAELSEGKQHACACTHPHTQPFCLPNSFWGTQLHMWIWETAAAICAFCKHGRLRCGQYPPASLPTAEHLGNGSGVLLF